VVQLEVPTRHEVNLGVFLPGGTGMLSATEAEPVRLWDLVGGACLREFGEYSNHAWALKATADRSALIGCRDAHRIASGDWSGEVRMWSMTG
jgi:hypothetical protein